MESRQILNAVPRVVQGSGMDVEEFGHRAYRPQGRPEWLFAYTVQGKGRFKLSHDLYFCTAGDVVLLAPGTEHDYATAHPHDIWEYYWVLFDPPPAWNHWLDLPETAPGLYLFPLHRLHIRRLIEVALHRLVQSTPGLDKVATALASNALEEVLIRVAGERYWGVAQPMDARIATILHFMTENFSQPITVDELAEMASLSASRLAHLFKEQVGDSIIQTLLKFRLRQAAHLLETTSLDVRTVAAEVGFQSMFYFSRQFKAHYELSPSAYRKQRDE